MTATTPPAALTTAETAERDVRFTSAIAQLRTKVSGSDIDRWFRLAGPVLMPLGALMIALAWYGAANTTRVFLQIPYLISGGVLGLGFMFVGGFVYFSRWITDVLDAMRAESQRAEEAEARASETLERIESLLRVAVEGGAFAGGASATAASADPTIVEDLVVTTHGKLVHLASCGLVAGRTTKSISAADAADRDLCQVCAPAL